MYANKSNYLQMELLVKLSVAEWLLPLSRLLASQKQCALRLHILSSCCLFFSQAENIYNDEEADNTPASELEA